MVGRGEAGLAGAVGGEPFRVAGQQIALTASVGVALADVDPPGLVLRNADVAMSRAKDAGGDRVEVYAAHMHADVVRRLEIVSDLKQAIGNGELTLQYQPIVELATSRVTGAEALVRWWRGDQMVPPQEFLGAAEESGLIVPLGEWVLREACAQGVAWRHSSSGSPEDVGVSVNLSARQITAPAFTTRVAAILADTGLPPGALTVEVNERVLVEEDGLIVERLAERDRRGCVQCMELEDAGDAIGDQPNGCFDRQVDIPRDDHQRLADGREFTISSFRDTQKTKNIAKKGFAALSIYSGAIPYRQVTVEGTARMGGPELVARDPRRGDRHAAPARRSRRRSSRRSERRSAWAC